MPVRAARQAGKVAAIYVAVGILWIFFSDQAVELLAADPAAARRLQTLKGWFFILASGLLIYYLVRSEIRRRLRAARRLESATDLLETTFRAIPDAVVILDLPRRVIRDVNPAGAALFGLSRGELLDRSASVLFEEEAHARRFAALEREAVEQGGNFTGVFQFRREGGATFLAEHCVGHVVGETDGTGEPELALMVLRDVTERVHQEAELERAHYEMARLGETLLHAQEIAGLGAWSRDLRTDRQSWSEETYRIFGLEPGSEMMLDRFLEMIHPDDVDRLRSALDATVERDEPLDVRFRTLRRDGEVRHVRGRGEVVRDEVGRPLTLHGVVHDITRPRRMERALRRSRRRAHRLAAHLQQAAEEERRNLAREMHDELGGALTGLKMQLVRLRAGLDEGAAKERGIAAEMEDLIDDVIRRVRGLSASLRPAILDDVGLVPAIQWLAERFEERAGIPCRLEWPSDSSVEALPLPRDRSIHVFRIVQEALTNVARHADAEEVCVRVERRDGALEVTVRDDGVGADSRSLRRRDAFGVQGMRERARLLEGRLRVGSGPEGGTVVQLRVPLPEPETGGAEDGGTESSRRAAL